MTILRYIFATAVTVLSGLAVAALIGLWLKIATTAFLLGWNAL